MREILVTNNPKVHEKYKEKMDTIYDGECDYLAILSTVRNKIHEGHKLLTHPLSGSVKPNETPYKSAIITKEKSNLDIESLQIIEDSISTAKKFIRGKRTPKWTEKILEDFQIIDFGLIASAIESMEQFTGL